VSHDTTLASLDATARIGIRGKLFAAFAGVAAMTLVASAVAYTSYGRIETSLGRVSGDGLPALSHSLELARQAADIAAVAPALLAADSPANLNASRGALEEMRRATMATLDGLGRTSIGAAADGLREQVKELEASTNRLAGAVEKRLQAGAERERLIGAALGAHQALVEKMIPLVDDAGFNLIIGLENAAGGKVEGSMAAALQNLSDQEARALLDLSDLRAETNLVLGLLSEASLVPRTDLLAPLRDRFTASSARAVKAVANLKALPNADELSKTLDDLLRVGKGSESLFDLRQRELAAAAEGQETVRVTRDLSVRVTGEVDTLVKRATATSGEAIAASGQAIAEAGWLLGVIALASLVAAAGIAWFYVGGIVVRRIARLNTAMLTLASGDLAVEIPHGGRDELSAMARAVEVFKRNALAARSLEEDQRSAQLQREQRHEVIETHIQAFDAKVGTLLQALDGASQTMTAASDAMSTSAAEASRQASEVASASSQATDSVQTVAAAAEEMSATVAEITQQITQSSVTAGRAVAEAKRTDGIVRGLAEGASKIGEVVQLIQAIAGQTNLLALNATIEAARAGEAGRGFAVVASEVKALATQTGRATEEIAAQIAAIQGATREAVDAIQGIGGIIDEVSQISTSIAAAMNEQGATTAEIARSTHHAAQGTQQVSASITVVSRAAAETGSVSGEVLAAAGDLRSKAEELRVEVDGFLSQIRAA
jgi:methyl-accepting chemotaxis protein